MYRYECDQISCGCCSGSETTSPPERGLRHPLTGSYRQFWSVVSRRATTLPAVEVVDYLTEPLVHTLVNLGDDLTEPLAHTLVKLVSDLGDVRVDPLFHIGHRRLGHRRVIPNIYTRTLLHPCPQCKGNVRSTAKTRNPNRPNRSKKASDLPVTAIADTEYCCDGMITLQVDHLDNYQRNAYGTTKWATDYAGRNPVEGVNGMIKDDGSFNPASCRVFGTAAHTLAALLAAVIHNLKHTRRARRAKNRDNITAGGTEQATPDITPPDAPTPHPDDPAPTRAPP